MTTKHTPGTPLKIIFLDIDGVLNSREYFGRRKVCPECAGDGWIAVRSATCTNCMGGGSVSAVSGTKNIDPAAVARLNAITEATGAKIVVTSAWRIGETVESMGLILRERGVLAEVIGLTPTDGKRYRGDQIQRWIFGEYCEDLDRCGCTFVILDDDSDMIPYERRLIQTKYEFGLTDDHVQIAIAMLAPPVVQQASAPAPLTVKDAKAALAAGAGAALLAGVSAHEHIACVAGFSKAKAARYPGPPPRFPGETSGYTPEQRKTMLEKMEAASGAFYSSAARTGCHAFIEFTGLMNEFIKICWDAESKGIDWPMANTHSEIVLPLASYQFDYLAEKLDCIYGPALRQKAGENPVMAGIFAPPPAPPASAPHASQAILDKLRRSATYHDRIANEASQRKGDHDEHARVSDQHAYAAQVLRDVLGEIENAALDDEADAIDDARDSSAEIGCDCHASRCTEHGAGHDPSCASLKPDPDPDYGDG